MTADASSERTVSARQAELRRYGLLAVLAVGIAALGTLVPGFYSTDNVINLLRQTAILGIVSLGQTMVMLVSGIDLTVGPVIGLTVMTVAEYTHAVGCSVTGGYVYRGTRARGLIGRYVYADFCTGTVWSMRAGPNPGGVRQETRLGPSLSNVTSFGEALNGDLFVIAGGTLYRFAGR